MTTISQVLKLHESLCKAGRKIMTAKHHDYTGGSDVFANFRFSETLGVPGELGLLIRVLDKVKRMETFVRSGTLLVPGEGFEDAVVDVINYMVLLAGMVEDRRSHQTGETTQVLKITTPVNPETCPYFGMEDIIRVGLTD